MLSVVCKDSLCVKSGSHWCSNLRLPQGCSELTTAAPHVGKQQESQKSSVFIRKKSWVWNVIQIEIRPTVFALFNGIQRCCLDFFWAWSLTHARLSCAACWGTYWCSSWLLRCLDTWHINLAFFSMHGLYLSDVCPACDSLCIPEGLELLEYRLNKGTHINLLCFFDACKEVC